mmetsp:Transcript_24493/g.39240  ORF Transcript_24493/g.39240 Transcript_24493/m.39240 type:complete len:258 (+) Transcript_24493:65-838(+)|eukprot:CAMPEP_0169119364 /NCGR_PEP_ID=MMETSP1015-20121227/31517_1 /TAXON_ID=342587 /ORGANISM="Karlodinium micrum, Strain CCMP2283" /LENGTH=257 /DNA_ID=CAMNT_0009182239 /DNA_START=65 /DNA_END=838 /DNA_ORIENTATION=+
MAEPSVDELPSKRARIAENDPATEGKGKKGKGKKGKDPPPTFTLVLDSVKHEYDEVYSYKFVSLDSKPLRYKAGQWGHLVAPGAEMGQGQVHHMSFASRAEEGHYLFTMDLASKSSYKQLFASAQPGAEAIIFKIKGDFVIDPAEQDDIVFVAGGIGLTPMRALIRDIVAQDMPVTCSLIHVARSKHLYQEELEKFTKIHQVRTNRAGAKEALVSSVKDKPGAWYYVCGSQRFVEGMLQILHELGITSEKIRTENFK